MPSLTQPEIKVDFYQSQFTVTLRLKPPDLLLKEIETSIETNSVSLTIKGEEVWRADLFGSVLTANSSARISGKWIEIELYKENPISWPELKRYIPKVKEVKKDPEENGKQIGVTQSEHRSDNTESSQMDISTESAVRGAPVDDKMLNAIENIKKCKVDNQSDIIKSEHSTVAKETLHAAEIKHSEVAKENQHSDVAKEKQHSDVAKGTHTIKNGSASIATDSNSQVSIPRIPEQSRTGLENIGNTCFINSVLQCLINCQPLRDFFLGGEYIKDVNKDNPLGYGGELARAFYRLLEKMWVLREKKCAPRYLKYLISIKNKTFSEYGQQDSHEYMTFLLDGLNEDLNRVMDKPLTNQVESRGRADKVVAEEAWGNHKKRNDSFITDNFQGQFKSTLVCPKCRKVSVTFDPFMTLSVPIPKKPRLFTVQMIWSDLSLAPRRFKLQLPTDATLELVKANLGRRIDMPMNKLRVFEAYHGKIQNYMKSDEISIKEILDSDVIIVTEVLSELELGNDDDEVVEMPVMQRTFTPKKPTKCAQCQKPEEVVELKRCTKCLSVAYCGRNCQSHHWPQHQVSCKASSDYSVIGLPFIVSLPRSQWTYRNIATEALRYASRSVDTEYCPALPEIPEGSGLTGSIFKFSAFSLRPVNNFGATAPRFGPLNPQDLDSIITEKFDFLGMDWKTDTKLDAFVKLTELNVDFVEDESMKTKEYEEPDILTLEHCIQAFSEPETLSQEDAWYCPQCKQHREATKMLSLWRLPPVLLIQLKRFFFRNIRYKEYKYVQHVEYPVHSLDMARFSMGESEQPQNYDLIGVINHTGGTAEGHYVAYANSTPSNKKGWMGYDDTITKSISMKDVVTDRAYILMYKRRPQ